MEVGFGVLAIIIYIIVRIFQSGMDERLTKDGYEQAIRSRDLVYYDQKSQCFRSTKTNQKAKKVLSRDVNGRPYEYVVTDSIFNTIDVGEFIEARYTDPAKWDEPVLFDDYHRNLFFGGK